MGFVAKIGAHESEASNLLKLNCKINDELVCCLLDSGATNLFMTLHAAKRFGVKTELMVDPITM
jgi:predicted aspartyl protease